MDPTASQDSGYGSQDQSSQSHQLVFSPRSPSPPSAQPLLLESPPSSQSLLAIIEEIPRPPIQLFDPPFAEAEEITNSFRQPEDQPPLSDQEIAGLYKSPSFRSPPIQYPDDTNRGDFFIQVENIVRSFPPDSFFLKWIRSDSNWYAHVVIRDNGARAEIIKTIDAHLEIAPAVDAYLGSRSGFCICPVTEDGAEVSRHFGTSDQ